MIRIPVVRHYKALLFADKLFNRSTFDLAFHWHVHHPTWESKSSSSIDLSLVNLLITNRFEGLLRNLRTIAVLLQWASLPWKSILPALMTIFARFRMLLRILSNSVHTIALEVFWSKSTVWCILHYDLQMYPIKLCYCISWKKITQISSWLLKFGLWRRPGTMRGFLKTFSSEMCQHFSWVAL